MGLKYFGLAAIALALPTVSVAQDVKLDRMDKREMRKLQAAAAAIGEVDSNDLAVLARCGLPADSGEHYHYVSISNDVTQAVQNAYGYGMPTQAQVAAKQTDMCTRYQDPLGFQHNISRYRQCSLNVVQTFAYGYSATLTHSGCYLKSSKAKKPALITVGSQTQMREE